MKKISPSILNSDFFQLNDTLKLFEKKGIETVHLDIMDGVFVPNLTFGPPFIEKLNTFKGKLEFISHLMIVNPEKHIQAFADAGSDGIIIHAEATDHLHSALMSIKSLGKKAGVALNPATPLGDIGYVLDLLDEILIMSVNPGFGGQSFIDTTYKKLEDLQKLLQKSNHKDIKIAIDGGINQSNLQEVFEAGVDVAIIGSAIFKSNNIEKSIDNFLKMCKDK